MPALDAPPGTDAQLRTPEYLETHIRKALEAVNDRTPRTPLTAASFPEETLRQIAPTVTPSDEYFKTSIETAHKAILYDIAMEEQLHGDDTKPSNTFADLLDIALVMAEQKMAEESLPFTMLEELFDTQTIPACERLFEYLESRVERLTAGMEGGKGKALVLLRLCNELLRRLSKAEDTIFCGRISIFLSKSFPIHERSAVNLRGDFNVDNITIYDQIVPDEPPTEDTMEIDESAPKEGSEQGKPGETKDAEPKREPPMSLNNLYTVFWQLQHDFVDPTRLFEPTNFERFKKGLAATMQKFREADEEGFRTTGGKSDNGSYKKHEGGKGPSTGDKRKRDDASSEELKGEGFNPKYLTSRELFELEISDLTFRRHVLVQAMILLDFLLGLTTSAKEKWTSLKTPNRSVQYAFTLSPVDEKWALSTRSEISSSLQPDQPGRLFMRLINTVLTREQNWVRWKAESCQKFQLDPLPRAEIEDAKAKAAAHTKPDRPFPHVMGTPALSRLWGSTGKRVKVDDLAEEERRRVPTLASFETAVAQDFEDLQDAMFPADIEAGHTQIHTKTWKAMRLASRSKFHVFNRFDDKPEELRDELKLLKETEEKMNDEKARAAQAVKDRIAKAAEEAEEAAKAAAAEKMEMTTESATTTTAEKAESAEANEEEEAKVEEAKQEEAKQEEAKA